MDRPPVHVAHDLTAVQGKAYRLTDNRSHDEASAGRPIYLALSLLDLKGVCV